MLETNTNVPRHSYSQLFAKYRPYAYPVTLVPHCFLGYSTLKTIKLENESLINLVFGIPPYIAACSVLVSLCVVSLIIISTRVFKWKIDHS